LFRKPCSAVFEADVVPVAAVPADVVPADAVPAAVADAVLVNPLKPCNRLLNDAVRFVVAALPVPPAESCWIKLCNEDCKLPSYWPANPAAPLLAVTLPVVPVAAVVVDAAVDATLLDAALLDAALLDAAVVGLVAALPPKPSAFNAWNKEAKNS
jgi:hypothetical protein